MQQCQQVPAYIEDLKVIDGDVQTSVLEWVSRLHVLEQAIATK